MEDYEGAAGVVTVGKVCCQKNGEKSRAGFQSRSQFCLFDGSEPWNISKVNTLETCLKTEDLSKRRNEDPNDTYR